MKRSEFLKKLGLGLGVAVVAPKVLMAEPSPVKEEVKLAIDMATISHFSFGGKELDPSEVLCLWKEQGILIYDSYHGNAPMIIRGETEVVDVNDYRK